MTRIAIVEGDGIGHEVIPVARSVLELLHPEYDYFTVEIGYGMWERTGCPCADKEIREMKDADAILFGAITTSPMKDYQSVVLRVRKALDLYANLRPVKDGGFDIMIVRENTEGLYSGIEECSPDRATTLRVVTKTGTERIIRMAIRLARQRRNLLTIGHKANVLKSDVFFRDICIAEAKEAGISFNDKFIDALSLDVSCTLHRMTWLSRLTSLAIFFQTLLRTLSVEWDWCRAQISVSVMPSSSRCMAVRRILPARTSPIPLLPCEVRGCS